VTPAVRSSDCKIFAYASLPEDLLEGFLELVIESQFLNEWNGIGSLRELNRSRLQSVERHEGNATRLFFDHDIEDLARGLISVDNDVK
jgi:hypothetical protein